MKLHLKLLILLAGLCAITAAAQLPSTNGSVATPITLPTNHSFSLDVQTKATGGASKSVAPTSKNPPGFHVGTETANIQARTHVTVLQTTVRNFSKETDQVHVEWFFFGKQVARGSQEFIFDSGSKDLNLQSMGTEAFEIASKPAESNTVTHVTTKVVQTGSGSYTDTEYSESKDGTKLTGWIVRISAGGKILQVRASDFQFEEIARDPDKFSKFKSAK